MMELLVTVFVSGITLASVVTFFAGQAHKERGHAYRLEAQQALRSSLDAITSDLRLAGACLPSTGQFLSVTGTNAASGDSITVRTGLVRTNLSCIKGTSLAVAAGATTLTFAAAPLGEPAPTNGFEVGMLVHLEKTADPGEETFVTGVGPTTLNLQNATTKAYNAGAGVYPIDERVYRLDKTDPVNPLLTLTVDRGAAEAFAVGVTDLQVQYLLNRNCPTCDVVDLPATLPDWWLVNEVYITATVKTVGAVRAEDQTTITATTHGKPRNLLP
jgi:type II secretory pathway pseudopilin PulG